MDDIFNKFVFSIGLIQILPNDQTTDVNSEFPSYWNTSSLINLSRYTVQPHTDEYRLVENNFRKTMRQNQIIGIERIQNRRKVFTNFEISQLILSKFFQVGIGNMSLIEMILLNDMVKVPNNGYFTV